MRLLHWRSTRRRRRYRHGCHHYSTQGFGEFCAVVMASPLPWLVVMQLGSTSMACLRCHRKVHLDKKETKVTNNLNGARTKTKQQHCRSDREWKSVFKVIGDKFETAGDATKTRWLWARSAGTYGMASTSVGRRFPLRGDGWHA